MLNCDEIDNLNLPADQWFFPILLEEICKGQSERRVTPDFMLALRSLIASLEKELDGTEAILAHFEGSRETLKARLAGLRKAEAMFTEESGL